MERHNRRSHLAPQLSPATQDLLRGSESPTQAEGSIGSQDTPTSGDIPIGGADVRSTIASPRDQVVNTLNSARSPGQNGSLGRSGGSAALHAPGLPRANTSGSVPKVTLVNIQDQGAVGGTTSANSTTFSHTLPMRPAPSTGGLPPPPVPKKESVDLDSRKEARRQANYGYPLNGAGTY